MLTECASVAIIIRSVIESGTGVKQKDKHENREIIVITINLFTYPLVVTWVGASWWC